MLPLNCACSNIPQRFGLLEAQGQAQASCHVPVVYDIAVSSGRIASDKEVRQPLLGVVISLVE